MHPDRRHLLERESGGGAGTRPIAREVTEENVDVRGQRTSPPPVLKRGYVHTIGRDDIEKYRDREGYY